MLNVHEVDPVPVEMQSPELRVFTGSSLSNWTSKYDTLKKYIENKRLLSEENNGNSP